VVGGGGMAVPDSAVVGGGGMTEGDRTLLRSGRLSCAPESIPLMLRLRRPLRNCPGG
jgi:hypothetical protein